MTLKQEAEGLQWERCADTHGGAYSPSPPEHCNWRGWMLSRWKDFAYCAVPLEGVITDMADHISCDGKSKVGCFHLDQFSPDELPLPMFLEELLRYEQELAGDESRLERVERA